MSLRRRVLWGFAAVALVLLAADVALAATFRDYLVGRVDDRLAATTQQLVEVLVDGPPRDGPGGGGPGEDGPGSDGPGGVPRAGGRLPRDLVGALGGALSEFSIQVADADGTVVNRLGAPLGPDRTPPAPPPQTVRAAATAPGQPLQPVTVDGDGSSDWRLVAVQSGNGPILLVGAALADIEPTLRRMVAVLALATAAVLVTLGAVAWWVLRQGIRPLAAMTGTAEAIAAGRLDARVADTDERTEAGRLGAALNVMLARIQDAFAARARSEARLRQFVADASHELRTPLTSIRGYAELYRAGGLPPGPQLDGALRRVEAEATRMGGLVEDLLTLARLDQGRPLERRTVDLADIATDAAADLRAVEPDRAVEVVARSVPVSGDDARLRQAVANLVANVRVHTPPGTPVRITTVVRDGIAEVEVADEGPGMAADVAERVFERFYRADPSRTRRHGGAGLGLSIVAGIVDAHGGDVQVRTAPGEGTAFVLRLPLAPPAAGTVAVTGGSAPVGSGRSTAPPPR